VTLYDQLPALQVAVLLFTAPIAYLLRLHGAPWAAATAAVITSFVIACSLAATTFGGETIIYEMGGWPAPYGIVLHIDALSALMAMLITGASSAALIFGAKSLADEVGEETAPAFFAAWLLCTSGLVGMVITGDAFNIFVFMEISSLATYVLVASGPDRRALISTYRYIVMGTVGATFYLIGVGFLYMVTGTLNTADLALRVAQVGDNRLVLVAAGFVSVGLAVKAAVFPLHSWMPAAYTYAPNAVTAFIAAASTKVSLYVLMRIDYAIFHNAIANHEVQLTLFLIPLGALALFAGSLLAIYEKNLKTLLAYSSVAQIGYIALGMAMASVAGLTGAIVHMFNHGIIKGGMFMAVAGLALRYRTVNVANLAGAGRAMPWTMAAFVIGGLGLIGVPLTPGFISKWYLVLGALEEGWVGALLVAIILASSLLAVIYVWKVIEVAYFKEPRANAAPVSGEAPLVMLIPTWIVVLIGIWFAIDTTVPVGMAATAARILLGVDG
jgi:multicomponent Na+:H+ antiporter subunit D